MPMTRVQDRIPLPSPFNGDTLPIAAEPVEVRDWIDKEIQVVDGADGGYIADIDIEFSIDGGVNWYVFASITGGAALDAIPFPRNATHIRANLKAWTSAIDSPVALVVGRDADS